MKRNTQNNGQLPIIDWQFNRIAVKIGSNVLTRKDGTLDITRMSALVDQVAKLHRKGVEVVLISSGAVASGRSEIKGQQKAGSRLCPPAVFRSRASQTDQPVLRTVPRTWHDLWPGAHHERELWQPHALPQPETLYGGNARK